MVHRSVNFDGSSRGKEHLKLGGGIEGEPEESQPIDEAITGQPAERMQLIEAWAERPFSQRTIKTVRDVNETVFRRSRCSRHVRERKMACRENAANGDGERRRYLAWKGGHGGVVQRFAVLRCVNCWCWLFFGTVPCVLNSGHTTQI